MQKDDLFSSNVVYCIAPESPTFHFFNNILMVFFSPKKGPEDIVI